MPARVLPPNRTPPKKSGKADSSAVSLASRFIWVRRTPDAPTAGHSPHRTHRPCRHLIPNIPHDCRLVIYHRATVQRPLRVNQAKTDSSARVLRWDENGRMPCAPGKSSAPELPCIERAARVLCAPCVADSQPRPITSRVISKLIFPLTLGLFFVYYQRKKECESC